MYPFIVGQELIHPKRQYYPSEMSYITDDRGEVAVSYVGEDEEVSVFAAEDP